jgi:hypothetical protein
MSAVFEVAAFWLLVALGAVVAHAIFPLLTLWQSAVIVFLLILMFVHLVK